MPESAFYTQFILDFVKQAGAHALALQSTITPQMKPDRTIVTKADLDISNMFIKAMATLPDRVDHFLVDEEYCSTVSAARPLLENTTYTWFLDPIDGTTPYAHHMPFWGIYCGVYKNGKPWLGAVYLPATNELVYTDSTAVFFQNQNKPAVKLTKPTMLELTTQTPIFAVRPSQYHSEKYCFMDVYCSAVFSVYTILGRSGAGFFGKPMKLWDVAAFVPITNRLGLSLLDSHTNKPIVDLDLSLIDENWCLKHPAILCHAEQFDTLKLLIL